MLQRRLACLETERSAKATVDGAGNQNGDDVERDGGNKRNGGKKGHDDAGKNNRGHHGGCEDEAAEALLPALFKSPRSKIHGKS